MALQKPGLAPDPAPETLAGGDANGGREHERERDHACARETESGGRVLALPGPRDPEPTADLVAVDDTELEQPPRRMTGTRARDVSARWVSEARGTARSALDGSVWRARPAALRDIHARCQRGEWAGDSAVLLWAGWIYGAFALTAVAGLYALAEVIKRPLRLLCALLLVLVPLLVMVL